MKVGTERKSAGYPPTLNTPERIRTSDLWFRRAKSSATGTDANP